MLATGCRISPRYLSALRYPLMTTSLVFSSERDAAPQRHTTSTKKIKMVQQSQKRSMCLHHISILLHMYRTVRCLTVSTRRHQKLKTTFISNSGEKKKKETCSLQRWHHLSGVPVIQVIYSQKECLQQNLLSL